MRMAPISTGRPVYSCASSTRRKYHGPLVNVASGRSATRPPKWRSSVSVMSVLVDQQRSIRQRDVVRLDRLHLRQLDARPRVDEIERKQHPVRT